MQQAGVLVVFCGMRNAAVTEEEDAKIDLHQYRRTELGKKKIVNSDFILCKVGIFLVDF